MLNKLYSLSSIETHRLIVRPVQLGDEILLSHVTQKSKASLLPWLPWAADLSVESHRLFIRRALFKRISQSGIDLPMLIFDKQSKNLIGGSGYVPRSQLTNGICEIGYWCAIPFQGKGYITEAVNALTRYALKELECKKVLLRINILNEKSLAVAQRLGFDKSGTYLGIQGEESIDYHFVCTHPDFLPKTTFSWTMNSQTYTPDQELFAWAKTICPELSYVDLSSSELVQKTPWSTVVWLKSLGQNWYCKRYPVAFPSEGEILKKLQMDAPHSVPKVLASHSDKGYLLMEDCGIPLREYLNHETESYLMIKAIHSFILLQQKTMVSKKEYLELGIPDFSTLKLAEIYKKCIFDNRSLLFSEGFSESDLHAFESLADYVHNLAVQIAAYPIEDALVQTDFNENNCVINQDLHVTHIDLGEVCLAHPFFSMINMLDRLKKILKDTSRLHLYKDVETFCYQSYVTQGCPLSKVKKLFSLSRKMKIFFDIVDYHRFIALCGVDSLKSFGYWKLNQLYSKLLPLIGEVFSKKTSQK